MANRLNSIDAKITINAAQAKGELARITSDLQKLNNAFQRGAPQLQSFSKNVDVTSVKLVGLKSNIDALNNSFGTLAKFGNILKTTLGGAYEYSTMMENNAIGISGILKSMVTLDGKTLEWNQAMRMSTGIMSKLRAEALQTSATSKDLIETFRALLGPGLGAGMKIEEIIKFTKVGVNAVRSMGLPTNQYIQELRGLEQGGLRASSSTLATALGLTDKDIKAAKASSEGLFKFLKRRLEGFEASTSENAKTVVGRIAILQEGLYSAMQEGGSGLYNKFSYWLKSISDNIYIIDEESKQLSLNPEFVAGVKEVFGKLESASDVVGTVFYGLKSNLGGITGALSNLLVAKAAFAMLDQANASVSNGASKVFSAYMSVKGFFSKENVTTVEEIYSNIRNVLSEIGKANAYNQEMDKFLKSIDGGVLNLAKHYEEMGVSAEQAAVMQKKVVDAILAGDKSYEQILGIKDRNEQIAKAALNYKQEKTYLEGARNIQERINAINEKHAIKAAEINDKYKARIENAEKELYINNQLLETKRQEAQLSINKEMDNNLYSSYTNANSRLNNLNSEAGKYNGGERTANSLLNMERQLVQLGLTRAEAEERVAAVRQAIANSTQTTVEGLTNEINSMRRQEEMDARELGRRRHIAEIREQETSSIERNISLRVREIEQAEAYARAEDRVTRLLSGRYENTRTINGTTTTTRWGQESEQFRRGQEINDALRDSGVDERTRINLLDRYINTAARNGDAGERVATATIAQAEAFRNSIQEAERYNVVLEQLTLHSNLYGEAQTNLTASQRALMIDAQNNLTAFGRENQSAALTIGEAWAALRDTQQAGFTNEENRLKTLLALEKEIAAGRMDVALEFANGYNSARDANNARQGGIANEIDNNEAVVKLREKIQKEEERLASIRAEAEQARQDLASKTNAQLRKQTEAMDDLTKAYTMNRALVEETVSLSAQEIGARQREILFNEAKSNVIKSGNDKSKASINELINKIRKEADEMEKAGLKGSEGYNLLIEALKKLSKTSNEEIDKVVADLHKLTKELDGAKDKSMSTGEAIVTSIGNVGVAIGGLGMAYQMCTNDVESNIGQMAEWAIKASTVISAAESVIPALTSLSAAYNAVAKSAAVAKLVQPGLIAIAGVTAVVGGGYLAYSHYSKNGAIGLDVENDEVKYLSEEEISAKKMEQLASNSVYAGLHSRLGSTSVENEMWLQAQEDAAVAEYRAKEAENLLNGKIENKYPPSETDSKKKGKDLEKEAERLAKKVRNAEDSYESLFKTVSIANGELTSSYTTYNKQYDEAIKKTIEWKKTLDNAFVNAGGKMDEDGNILGYGKITKEQYEEMLNKFKEYIELEQKDILLKEQYDKVNNDIQHANNLYDMQKITQQQSVDLQRTALEEKKRLIEKEMELYSEGSTKRIEKEKELAATLKEIRNNDMLDMKTAWKAALTEISLQQINFGEGIKSVFSSVQSAGATLLSSTASFSEKIATFFQSITESILENMARMIMQGLITNAILSAFGGGGNITVPGMTGINTENISKFANNANWITPKFAKGGYASGWSIVGEQGPELVNFSNPARVYTAQQTANALSGTSGNVNIKIDLKNESGQQMQAETTGTSFDGESYIVGVVLKAISTNKNGIRTVLRGV